MKFIYYKIKTTTTTATKKVKNKNNMQFTRFVGANSFSFRAKVPNTHHRLDRYKGIYLYVYIYI